MNFFSKTKENASFRNETACQRYARGTKGNELHRVYHPHLGLLEATGHRAKNGYGKNRLAAKRTQLVVSLGIRLRRDDLYTYQTDVSTTT